jgi:hypothetical protein
MLGTLADLTQACIDSYLLDPDADPHALCAAIKWITIG